jgi:hypothetical protein
MKINNEEGIYRIIAGDPKEEDEDKIFLRENIAFEEADRIFDFLLEKRQYPVILLDEGDITIRGFKEPGNVEQDYRYTELKEDLQRRTNPGYKPHYVVIAWKDYAQNSNISGAQQTTQKLSESEDLQEAFKSYLLYVKRFKDYGSHFDGVKIIDSKLNRLIDSAVINHNNHKESKELKRKKKEDPGYER